MDDQISGLLPTIISAVSLLFGAIGSGAAVLFRTIMKQHAEQIKSEQKSHAEKIEMHQRTIDRLDKDNEELKTKFEKCHEDREMFAIRLARLESVAGINPDQCGG